MSFLDLHLPENKLSLDLLHDPDSSSSSSLSSLNNAEQRVFSCSYCRRKFYSPQAFGGHQNAHKLERTLAKKSRELSSAVRRHSDLNQTSSRFHSDGSSHVGEVQPPVVASLEHQGHLQRFSPTETRKEMDCSYKGESVQDDFNQLDLSLRL